MKIDSYVYPKSSFLSLEKDMSIITSAMMKNERLKKLLYYNTKDCLDKSNLTPEQSAELFGKNIKLVPKLYVDGSVYNYIIVSFDQFMRNVTNPEFRDNIIEFDIICHFDCWQLKDFQLRPYRIAAELDSVFDKSRLSGIGRLEFLGANQIILTDEYAGLCLMYQAIHGEDDKKNAPNPLDEINIEDNFNQMFNQ